MNNRPMPFFPTLQVEHHGLEAAHKPMNHRESDP
jgi:hypothetical protein